MILEKSDLTILEWVLKLYLPTTGKDSMIRHDIQDLLERIREEKKHRDSNLK